MPHPKLGPHIAQNVGITVSPGAADATAVGQSIELLSNIIPAPIMPAALRNVRLETRNFSRSSSTVWDFFEIALANPKFRRSMSIVFCELTQCENKKVLIGKESMLLGKLEAV